ncbi:MAG: hypothetical protein ACRDG5_00870, partial [Anaerolineales bacterium]
GEPPVSRFQATFTLSRNDHVRANRAILNRRRDTRAIYLFMGLAAVLVVGANLLTKDGPSYSRMSPLPGRPRGFGSVGMGVSMDIRRAEARLVGGQD